MKIKERMAELMEELTAEFGCPVALVIAAEDSTHASLADASGCTFEAMVYSLLGCRSFVPRHGVCPKCADALDRCGVVAGMLRGGDA